MLPDGPGSDGPFLVADIYEGDITNPDFSALVNYPNVVGVILKATQGTQYRPQWFLDNWQPAMAAGGTRYGSSWFRGAYHFGVPTVSGADQADFFLDFVDQAGGWGSGDMPAIWDLEGGAWSSAQQIIDISADFAARVVDRTGRSPILYAGSLVRDTPVTDHMGFDSLWSPHLDLTKVTWDLSQYIMWQYAGDLKFYNPASAMYGVPPSIPGFPGGDMSVVLDNGGIARDITRVQTLLTGRAAGLSMTEIALIALTAFGAVAAAIKFDRWLSGTKAV